MREYKPGDLVLFTDYSYHNGKVGTIIREMSREEKKKKGVYKPNARNFVVLVEGKVCEQMYDGIDFFHLGDE